MRADIADKKVYYDLLIEKAREDMRLARESSLFTQGEVEDDYDNYSSEYSYNTEDKYTEEEIEEELRRREAIEEKLRGKETIEEELRGRETTEIESEKSVEDSSSNKYTSEVKPEESVEGSSSNK
jgi:L-arabinose isomerase